MYFLRDKFLLKRFRAFYDYNRLFKQTGCAHKPHYLHYSFIECSFLSLINKDSKDRVLLEEKAFNPDNSGLKEHRAKIKESIDMRKLNGNI